MSKVVIQCKGDEDVKEALIKEAEQLKVTPSFHIHSILKKHVSKQESKPINKKEYR